MKTNTSGKPTPEQLLWQEQEFGVIIHYIIDIYAPHLSKAKIKSKKVRTVLPVSKINPTDLDAEQWVRSAWEAGAKYAILVANHCTGFSLWPTKVNDYCTRSMKWKNGKGDIVDDFIKACKKYEIKPGLYYSTAVNGYYNISDRKKHDYNAPYYQNYLKKVEAQVTELWSQYGPLFEIWFDGGIISPENGGLDLQTILNRYQPSALCFQGPITHPHNIRWVGNEEGLAPENCWSTTNFNSGSFNGTQTNEKYGEGIPEGKYYCPAEADTPNRSTSSFGGGWAWKKGQRKKLRSPEELLECYIKSVGRNSNLLLGMAINTAGQFEDEDQFIAFGNLLKKTFGKEIVKKDGNETVGNKITLKLPDNKTGKYLSIREELKDGQKIRGFRVFINGKNVYQNQCIGHRRIIPLSIEKNASVTVEITEAINNWELRDLAVY